MKLPLRMSPDLPCGIPKSTLGRVDCGVWLWPWDPRKPEESALPPSGVTHSIAWKCCRSVDLVKPGSPLHMWVWITGMIWGLIAWWAPGLESQLGLWCQQCQGSEENTCPVAVLPCCQDQCWLSTTFCLCPVVPTWRQPVLISTPLSERSHEHFKTIWILRPGVIKQGRGRQGLHSCTCELRVQVQVVSGAFQGGGWESWCPSTAWSHSTLALPCGHLWWPGSYILGLLKLQMGLGPHL